MGSLIRRTPNPCSNFFQLFFCISPGDPSVNIWGTNRKNMYSDNRYNQDFLKIMIRALSRPVRPRLGEEDNGRDSRVLGWGRRPSTSTTDTQNPQ